MWVVDGKHRASEVQAAGRRCQNRGRFSCCLGGLGLSEANVKFERLERFLPQLLITKLYLSPMISE